MRGKGRGRKVKLFGWFKKKEKDGKLKVEKAKGVEERKKVDIRSLWEKWDELRRMKLELYARLAINNADLYFINEELKRKSSDELKRMRKHVQENIEELKENIEYVEKEMERIVKSIGKEMYKEHPDLESLNLKYKWALERAKEMKEKKMGKEEIKRAILEILGMSMEEVKARKSKK